MPSIPAPPDCLRLGRVLADAADGTDGADSLIETRTYRDDSISGSTFTTKRNLYANGPQERMRATQAAGEGARIFRPADLRHWDLASTHEADLQKIGGAARPRAALAHELPHAGGDRVRVDDALDRGLSVVGI